MTFYARWFSKKNTPQKHQAHPQQRRNNAGGFSFVLSDWQRLDRFLILGSEGGTFYTSERKLTLENAQCVERCLAEDGARVVKRVTEISQQGRAPKNDAAIFVLALASASEQLEVRRAALSALPAVCRTGTHLFQYAESVKQFRGWGRALRRAIANWYNEKTEQALSYQVVKYRERNGWSHRDLIRLAHPDAKHAAICRWVVGAELGARDVRRSDRMVSYDAVPGLPGFIAGYEELKRADSVSEVVRLVKSQGFTHEMVPTDLKRSPEVWAALLDRMPLTAMVRNLGKMTQVGLIAPGSSAAKLVEQRLTDKAALEKARVHPLALLLALGIYKSGHGFRGSLKWTPERRVLDALDEAFYLAFDAIEPTGKRILLALDVSASMTGGVIGGAPGVTPRIASAAMSMVTARTENEWHVVLDHAI